MSATYQKFHERLKEQRLLMELSQLEISQFLRMSQSHYSKAELGKRRLSYYEIQCLCETKVNVYYIFTGEKCKIELQDLFSECTFEEIECYLEILCVLLMYLYKNNMIMLSANMYKKIENIQYVLMPCKKGKTIFYKLRRALNYNQMKMANLLEVDIKKLRSMESGKVLPDSEIIWRLSEIFYIPYALLLKDKKGLVCEISCLLNLIDERRRKDILDSIKSIHKTFYKSSIGEVH